MLLQTALVLAVAVPMFQDRVHLVSPANPLAPDAARFGFSSPAEFVKHARRHLPTPYRLTANMRLLNAQEAPWKGGRRDDAARVRDLNAALADEETTAIVASNGGAYLSRILTDVNFNILRTRKAPLVAVGFSEITGLVNAIASYRCGRGYYWLCPTWLGWAIKPKTAARAALAEFWQTLPALISGEPPAAGTRMHFGPLEGRIVRGRVASGSVRLMGGCLAVLVAVAAGKMARRIRPDGKWLMLEDIREPPYRIDRHLATLKHAGWLERVSGVLVGDFRMMHKDTQPAVVELLRYHLPVDRPVPIVVSRSFGHTWPTVPVPLNVPLSMTVVGRQVRIERPVGRCG